MLLCGDDLWGEYGIDFHDDAGVVEDLQEERAL